MHTVIRGADAQRQLGRGRACARTPAPNVRTEPGRLRRECRRAANRGGRDGHGRARAAGGEGEHLPPPAASAGVGQQDQRGTHRHALLFYSIYMVTSPCQYDSVGGHVRGRMPLRTQAEGIQHSAGKCAGTASGDGGQRGMRHRGGRVRSGKRQRQQERGERGRGNRAYGAALCRARRPWQRMPNERRAHQRSRTSAGSRSVCPACGAPHTCTLLTRGMAHGRRNGSRTGGGSGQLML